MVVAALTEQSVSDDTTSIEHVEHGVGVLNVSKAHYVEQTTYLGKRGSKDNNLVDLAHFSEEVINARSFNDINVVRLRFNFDGDDVVCGRQHLLSALVHTRPGGTYLEAGMEQCLVEIKYQTLSPGMLLVHHR